MDSRWFHSHPNLPNLDDYQNSPCPCKEFKTEKKKKKKKLSPQQFCFSDLQNDCSNPTTLTFDQNLVTYYGKRGPKRHGKKDKKFCENYNNYRGDCGTCHFSQNNLLSPPPNCYGFGLLDKKKSRSSSDLTIMNHQMARFGPSSSQFQLDPHDRHHHHHCSSRQDMLNWVNGCLNSNYTKVEELGSGLAYCQLINLLWPGCVSLKKVKFYARHEQERVQNFKVLEGALKKFQVYKVIPTEKLVKGRFQDNFEFLQWFTNFWMGKYNGAPTSVKGLSGSRMNLPLVGGMARLPLIGYGNRD